MHVGVLLLVMLSTGLVSSAQAQAEPTDAEIQAAGQAAKKRINKAASAARKKAAAERDAAVRAGEDTNKAAAKLGITNQKIEAERKRQLALLNQAMAVAQLGTGEIIGMPGLAPITAVATSAENALNAIAASFASNSLLVRIIGFKPVRRGGVLTGVRFQVDVLTLAPPTAVRIRVFHVYDGPNGRRVVAVPAVFGHLAKFKDHAVGAVGIQPNAGETFQHVSVYVSGTDSSGDTDSDSATYTEKK